MRSRPGVDEVKLHYRPRVDRTGLVISEVSHPVLVTRGFSGLVRGLRVEQLETAQEAADRALDLRELAGEK